MTFDGRIRLLEHFQWESREGSGTNTFEEVPGPDVGAPDVVRQCYTMANVEESLHPNRRRAAHVTYQDVAPRWPG